MLRSVRAAAVLVIVTAGTLAAPPGWAEVTRDVIPPTVSIQGRRFIIGSQIDPASGDPEEFCRWTVAPMNLYWRGADDGSGIAGYTLSSQQAPPSADGWDVLVPDTTRTRYRTSEDDQDCYPGQNLPTFFRVVARDHAGNTSRSIEAFSDIGVYQEDGRSLNTPLGIDVSTTGTWRRASCDCSDAGHTAYSTQEGATASYTSEEWGDGTWVALVMAKGPDRGEVSVTVDGGSAALVDTYAESQRDGVVVWQRRFTTDGPHTIAVTNLGTDARSRVDIDSLLQTRD